MTHQPRQPKGQPTGGEFSGKSQSPDELGSLTVQSQSPEPVTTAIDRITMLAHDWKSIRDCRDFVDENIGADGAQIRFVSVISRGHDYLVRLYDDAGQERDEMLLDPEYGSQAEFLDRGLVPRQFEPDNIPDSIEDGGSVIDVEMVRNFDYEQYDRHICEQIAKASARGLERPSQSELPARTENPA